MFAWVDLGDGRRVFRKIHAEAPRARSDLAAPMILNDRFDKPVQSMADGKWYESKAALRSTYKPSGNPEGKTFEEVGNEDTSKRPRIKSDRKAIREAIHKAEADIASGNVPPARYMSEIGGD
jgi:hypothetical protein